MAEKRDFKRVDKFIWELPKSARDDMRVPARLFGDAELFDAAFRDRTVEQLTNVATLPGIVKSAMAMPDFHQGYGFCIGGVAAMHADTGVISPGGVGYDINCIGGASRVLHSLGYTIRIADMADDWTRAELRCQDLQELKLTTTSVVRWFAEPPNVSIFRLATVGGNEIVATADHPFWTPDGMTELQHLQVGDRVAMCPFAGVPYARPIDEVIIEEKDVTLVLESVGKKSRRSIQILKERGLLPLRFSSKQLPYLLKIAGYVWGDGTMGFGGRRKQGNLFFYGQKPDLEEIRHDIWRLGYSPTSVRERRRRHSIGDREFVSASCEFQVASTGLVALLAAMGCPLGKKAEQDFDIPEWIFRAPLWHKRLFLAAYFGAELSAVAERPDRRVGFVPPKLTLNKRSAYVDSGRRFLESIARLLGDFDVKTARVVREDAQAPNVDGSTSTTLRLVFSLENDSLIALWGQIGYEYSEKRQLLACVAAQYLRLKKAELEMRAAARAQSVALYQRGLVPAAIAQGMDDASVNLRFVERSAYDEATTSVYVSREFPSFDEYLRASTAGLGRSGMVWARIASIELLEDFDQDVYDFTVAHPDHNFVANGFVVSNCGVRLLGTHLEQGEVAPHVQDLTAALYRACPSGVGGKGRIRVSGRELDTLLTKGAQWALRHGQARQDDLAHTEEQGCLPGADPNEVSERAKERGRPQVGSLGAGNHFLEIDVVDEVYDPDVADVFGLWEDQIVVQIHCGSRGLGHQVCDDNVKGLQSAVHKYGIQLPDRELVCAPLDSPEGRAYYGAMACAVNYAFVNRQILAMGVREAFEQVLAGKVKDFDLFQVYDVCHNIAKFEEHEVDGRPMRLCVHRKGATRAFGPGRPEVPADYRSVGQPVLVPGSMGTTSYVLVGTDKAMALTFGSSCHGAGRVMSRSRARKTIHGADLRRELHDEGVVVRAGNDRGLAEEAPAAYKDVSRVVEVVDGVGIARKVARLRPLGVIKG
jgi:tRNA-splicing ligase RtcB